MRQNFAVNPRRLDKSHGETAVDAINAKTGMTHAEAREFIRNHFEEFVNKKNVAIGNVNFSADFADHGADVPPGPAGAIQYVGGALKRFPDLHVQIEDMIAEDDKVVVRNHWTATDSQSGKKLEFRGIVIWRIADRRIAERWAYLEPPHAA
jgi:predicted SnoaL-like aldol condensation-catalyzing enzyme